MIENLHRICAGTVKTFLCDNVSEAVASLCNAPCVPTEDQKIVTIIWDKLPPIETLMDETLEAMAEVALRLWPAWFNSAASFSDSHGGFVEASIRSILDVAALTRARQEVSTGWLKAAVRRAINGKRPLPEGFPRAVQASQLALAIHPDQLFIMLASVDICPANELLMGLARSAEWLAEKTKSRVAVLVPEHWREHSELDSILYGADVVVSTSTPRSYQPEEQEAKHAVWPVIGKPHPFSPGEQELARRLAGDSDLRDLFRFNQRVLMDDYSTYLVDLLWPEGKVVVEVDGFTHHSNRFAFSSDRHRDYELLIRGYAVLRLPHDEVMSDPALAVEKIRDVVMFRRRQE